MTSIRMTGLLRHIFPMGLFLIAAALGIIFTLGAAEADDMTSSEAAVAEMKEMFGKIPPRMQEFPKSATAAGWALIMN